MIKKYLNKILYSQCSYSLSKKLFRLSPSLAAYTLKRSRGKFFLKEGLQQIDSGTPLPEGASREDFIRANREQRLNLSEYINQYKYYDKSEAERQEFFSYVDFHALALKLRMMHPEYDNKALLKNKERFLATATEYGLAHRRWLFVPNATYEEFAAMLASTDCILKPHNKSWGNGIEKASRQEGPQVKELYESCVANEVLMEEVIHGYEATQAFHPASLNTVRVTTIAFEGKAVVFAAMLRVGRGNMFLDNTHAGGLYAQINVETGIVESDGIDSNGDAFAAHPDTGIPFKGFQIPFWNDITAFCLNAARQTKSIFVGWDVAITDKGTLEIIEANSRPDFDGLQTPLRLGLKTRLFKTLDDLGIKY